VPTFLQRRGLDGSRDLLDPTDHRSGRDLHDPGRAPDTHTLPHIQRDPVVRARLMRLAAILIPLITRTCLSPEHLYAITHSLANTAPLAVLALLHPVVVGYFHAILLKALPPLAQVTIWNNYEEARLNTARLTAYLPSGQTYPYLMGHGLPWQIITEYQELKCPATGKVTFWNTTRSSGQKKAPTCGVYHYSFIGR
jgi:hypothetical protein